MKIFLLLLTLEGIANRVIVDPLVGSPSLEFFVECNVKQNWFVRIVYIDQEDINNTKFEKFNVNNSNSLFFIRRFDIKPPNIEFIHSCSSDPEKPLFKTESFEYTRNTTLDNKGVKIEPKPDLDFELERFTFILACSLKFNWNLTILYFYNDDKISKSYNETINIEENNSVTFIRNMEKPDHFQYIHDCTSTPNQAKLVDGGNERTQYFEFADKGLYQSKE